MTNQIVFFGEDAAKQDAAGWKRLPFDRAGEIVYRLAKDEEVSLAEDSLPAAFERLRQIIASSPGAVIAIDCTGVEPTVRTAVKTSKQLSLPERLVTLSFAGHTWWRPLSTSPWPLNPWDALVVPVNRKTEEALTDFVAAAVNLPPTSRASVFQQLTMPTLESRVARIELYESMGTYQARHDSAVRALIVQSSLPRQVAMWSSISSVLLGLVTLAVVLWRLGDIEDRLPGVSAERQQEVVARVLPNQARLWVQSGSTEDQVLTALNTLPDYDGQAFQLDQVGFAGNGLSLTGGGVEQLRNLAAIVHAFPKSALEVAGVIVDGDVAGMKRHWDLTGTSVIEQLRTFGAPASQVRLRAFDADANEIASAEQSRFASVRIVNAAATQRPGSGDRGPQRDRTGEGLVESQ